MTSTARAGTAVIAVVLALTSTACGGGSSPRTATPSATPANVAGDGYSFSLPRGWKETEEPAGFDTDSFGVDSDDGDGFVDNVNVIVADNAGEGSTDAAETAAVSDLRSAGAMNIEVKERADLDGVEAIRLSSRLRFRGRPYVAEQYAAVRGGTAYVVTFSFSPDVPRRDRDELAASVVATWRWAS